MKITEKNTIHKLEEFTVIKVQEIKHEEAKGVELEENSQPLESTKKIDDGSKTNVEVGNLNSKNARGQNKEPNKETKTYKGKEQTVLHKKGKNEKNSQPPIDKDEEILNTTKIPRNATKKQVQMVNIHNSATNVDPMKRNKRSYNKKIPKDLPDEKDKKTYTRYCFLF